MMDCSEIRRFLHAYIDLEFDEREQIEFELHLAQCNCCREEVNYYRALRRTLRKNVPCKVAPAHLESLIKGTIDQEIRNQQGWFSLSLATVGAFALALGTFLYSSNVNVNNSFVASKKIETPSSRQQNVSFGTNPQAVMTKKQFLRDIIAKSKKMSEELPGNLQQASDEKPTISLRECDLPGQLLNAAKSKVISPTLPSAKKKATVSPALFNE